MEELEKWEKINGCETIEELELAIHELADEQGTIKGRTRDFRARDQVDNVRLVIQGNYPANILTRSYGIRQQALYLRFYLHQRKF